MFTKRTRDDWFYNRLNSCSLNQESCLSNHTHLQLEPSSRRTPKRCIESSFTWILTKQLPPRLPNCHIPTLHLHFECNLILVSFANSITLLQHLMLRIYTIFSHNKLKNALRWCAVGHHRHWSSSNTVDWLTDSGPQLQWSERRGEILSILLLFCFFSVHPGKSHILVLNLLALSENQWSPKVDQPPVRSFNSKLFLREQRSFSTL